MKTIEPRTLKGFRDFLPESAIARQRIVNTIVAAYQSFGFVPLETPALEYADVLTGKYGDEGEKLMYRFQDQGGRDVALRYDLTVPLARVVAQYADLPKPFRRYQIAPVWRAENTQKGRFREFTQCDFDIVGTASTTADAEVAQIIATVLRNLNFQKFQVRINNRKVLNGLLASAGVAEEQWVPAIRSIDKWLKVGADAVRQEVTELVGTSTAEKVFALLPSDGGAEDFAAWAQRVQPLFSSPEGIQGLSELQEVGALLAASGLPAEYFRIDVLLARGLDYYTGTIYEATLLDKPEFGSVFGGGRFDKLIGQFIGRDIPAVGASAGVDRLLAAQQELGMTSKRSSTAKILVAMMDDTLRQKTAAVANELRAAGINTELFYDAIGLGKQLKYADKLGIPYVIILGPDEVQAGTVTIKDLAKKEQSSFPRERLAEDCKQLIASRASVEEVDRERFLRGEY